MDPLARHPRPPVAGPLVAACAMALVACGGNGGQNGDDPPGSDPPAGDPPPSGSVTISGKARYEFPPPVLPGCSGLDFNSIELRPIRQAPVQAIDAATQAVLAETVSDDNGDWSLTVDAGTEVFLRVRAELQKAGSPSWDVQVRDNTSRTDLAILQRPIYVLDGAAFDSGGADLTRDITAATGWDGTGYTGARSAAPFAVLDAIYRGMLLVLSEEPGINFEPLDVFWSVNNTTAQGDVNVGEIGTSFYSSDNRMFLLGMEGDDAEEFDHHVIVHEWGHYFEDTLSRSDSRGGPHALGDLLDMRVAFGEGWATAYSGMALESPDYCDTLWFGDELTGFRINIEGQATPDPGWYSEVSILKLIYDLWDSPVADDDGGSIGFGPIYDVMTGPQATTPAFTSIFTFAEALKAANPAAGPFIDEMLIEEEINPVDIDPWGGSEFNDAGAEDVLPVYTTIEPDGSVIDICSNGQFDPRVDGNKLSEFRYLRMTLESADRYTFEVRTTGLLLPPDDPENDRDQSDPDLRIFLNGVMQNAVVDGDLEGTSPEANQEVFTSANILQAGEYVLELVEFRYLDEESPGDYPQQTCFDVSVSPAT